MTQPTLWVLIAQDLQFISPEQAGSILAEWSDDPRVSVEARVREVLDGAQQLAIEERVREFFDAQGGGADRTVETPGGAKRSTRVSSVPPGGPEDDDVLVCSEDPSRYVVKGELGRGSFGKVFVAYDQFLGRLVAIKELIRDHHSASDTQKARLQGVLTNRFLREARVTGQLQHPSIIPVYELGRRSTGELFYTMKQVKGQTLSDRINSSSSLEDGLRLLPHFRDLCNAIAFAHDKSVIHRDIKPTNVMIGEFGETVVLDWGLAKVRGEQDDVADEIQQGVLLLKGTTAEKTTMGSTIGTPAYMSPEQARGQIGEIDELSDIYALGGVLYEILSGHAPYQGASAAEVMEKVLNDPIAPLDNEPHPPPPELAAIAAKALSKDKKDRYRSARELAVDVEAYMSGEKVAVYEYSSVELLTRFASKNKFALVAAACVLVALVFSLISNSMALTKERASNEQMQAAVRLERHAKQQAYFHMAQGYEREARGLAEKKRLLGARVFSAASLLHNPANPQSLNYNPDFAVSEPLGIEVRARANSRLYEAQFAETPRLDKTTSTAEAIYALAVSPDGQWIAAGGEGKTISLYHADTLRPDGELVGHEERVYTIEYSPDGKTIFSGSNDRTVRAFDAKSKQQLWRFDFPGNRVFGLAVSPDGKWVAASGMSEKILLLDRRTGRLVGELEGHHSHIHGLAFSPDGMLLASGGSDKTVRLWNVGTWDLVATLEGHTTPALGLSFSHDGLLLASGSNGGVVRIWDMESRALLCVLEGPKTRVYSTVFSADDKRILTSNAGRFLRVWDSENGELISSVQAHNDGIYVARFLGQSKRFVSASVDRTIKTWVLEQPSPIPRLEGHDRFAWSVGFSSDGKRLVSSSIDMTARVWDIEGKKLLKVLSGHSSVVFAAVFSPDDTLIATAGGDKTVRFWDGNTFEFLFELSGHTDNIYSLAFSEDGTTLASGGSDTTIRIWDVANKKQLRTLEDHEECVYNLRFINDDKQLISAGADSTVRLWDLASGAVKRTVKTEDWITGLDVTKDGKWLFTSGKDRRIVMWDLATLTKIKDFVGHEQWVNTVTASPDARYIVSASDDNTVRLWSVDSAESLLILPGTKIISAGYAPDGRTLAVTDENDIRLFPVDLSIEQQNPQQLLEKFERTSGLTLKGFVLENQSK